ncbi:MAG: aminotransferase class III-fold pyridoxal phosphate-dependent enzyme [Bdellovibrionales bacterium]|nr:aminotransferase class III-fold pyridoxal phosphate-dependent enzyme [Bdellovibrionales bacterium]
MTLGQALKSDEKILNTIHSLVEQAQEKSRQVEGIRPPSADQKTSYEEILDRFAEVRGRPLFYPYVGSGAGRGPYVELADGSVKLDFINGIGVHIFGHSHPTVIKANIQGSLQDILMQGHLQMNEEYLNFSRQVLDFAKNGSRLRHGWISPSGSMANENALKMARQKNSPARKIIAMKDAFAGRTTMMAELTDNPGYKQGLPEYHEVLRVPFYDKNDPDSTEKSLQILKEHIANNPGDISCFCFEPMLGEGGYKVAPREFFIPLLEECKKNNIAVWADEVQTFLRTGQPFAFQTIGFGEYVDLCTIAKTAQCGMTLYTEEYNPKPGLVAGTFASSSPALTAGTAIMQEMENGGFFGKGGRIEKIHNEFVQRLEELCKGSCKGFLEDPEGLGLMIAVTPLSGDKDKTMKLLKVMFEKGFIAFGCGKSPFRLRFLVPAIVTSEDLQVACAVIEESILEMKDQ